MRSVSALRMVGIVLVFALVSLASAPAEAKVRTYLPERFKLLAGSTGWAQRPLGIQNGSFWVPVKLPVGSRIRKVVFYHWGTNVSSSLTWVILSRTKMGLPTSSEEDFSFSTLVTTYTGPSTSTEPLEVVVDPASPDVDTVIRPGYRYAIQVTSSNSIVGGVKVFYLEP